MYGAPNVRSLTSRDSMSLLLVSICLIGLSATEETITLEDETEIKYAVAVNEAIDRLSEKVMSCIENNGGKAEGCVCDNECSCEFKDDYIAAKKAYQSAIKAYPHWEGEVVFYQKEDDPTGYNINFAGLQRQFSVSCEE